MGRIDEALRRAAPEPAGGMTPVIPAEEMFASPWSPAPSTDLKAAGISHARRESSVLNETAKPSVVRFNPDWFDLLTISPNVDLRLAEQFRRLAGNLHNAQIASQVKTVLTTSAAPGDGKTLTSMNLALV